ncbi:MAG TPA: VWA domain-containing protein [Candidatus Dormibacteraeota bacterium]|nr:VWA domain-containing protein [Candidatus Dormibacteraeota bacterium]
MTFLAPAAAALGLTLPAIIALYFLRIRRPTRVVPALHLWPEAIRDRQANVPWQRLRFSWLLVLQLLVAAMLVAAAVQPALSASANVAADSIVLLDASASMQASDVQPSRFAEAKREAGALIDEIGAQDRMTLIAVDATPRVVAAVVGDHDAMHRALDAVVATNGPANLSTALSLAAGIVRPGEGARAYLYSDGITEPLQASFTAGLPFAVEYHRIGVSGENLAIVSLIVRTSAQSRAAYARVENFGRQPHSFTLEWRSDAGLIDVRPMTLAAGQAQDVVLPVPENATTVTAHIDGGDNFSLDDSATAIARVPRVFHVLLVTPGNVFLEQALRLRSDFRVDVVTPSAYRGATAYALIVFDRFSPPVLPDGPLVMVDPPAGSPLAGAPPIGIGRVRASDAGDPLLNNVSLQDVHVARSEDLTRSTFGRALITSAQTPLVLVRDQPFRQALFGFDVHDSDFPLRIGFPILVQNLTEWMLPPTVPASSFHPDEAVTVVPAAGASNVAIIRPDGNRRQLATTAVSTFADTDRLGVYAIEQKVNGQTETSWFAVNLFAESESRLAPIDHLTLPPVQTSGVVSAPHRGLLAIWPLIALLALALLLGEWLAFHRGL